MVESSPSKSTSMLFFSRFTDTEAMPWTFAVAFSTRAEHAAHVMPVTSNVRFMLVLLPALIARIS